MSEEPISHSTGTDPGDFTDTNAGDDAVMGTVADQEPTDIGDQKPMDEIGGDEPTAPEGNGETKPAE